MFQLLGEHLVTQLCVYNGQSFHFPVVKMELNICKNMAVAPNHRIFTRPHTPPNRPCKRHQESALSGREGPARAEGSPFFDPGGSPAPRHGRRCLCAGAAASDRWGRGLWSASLPAAAGGSAILNVERPRAQVGTGSAAGATTSLRLGLSLCRSDLHRGTQRHRHSCRVGPRLRGAAPR